MASESYFIIKNGIAVKRNRFDSLIKILMIFMVLFGSGIYAVYSVKLKQYQEKFQIKAERKLILQAQNEKLANEVLALKILSEYQKVQNSWVIDLTAYTARPEETNNDPENTAIMQAPRPDYTMAVSPDLQFLLGKRVYIRGYGVRLVNDIMNARYSKRGDLLVSSVQKAREIGVNKNVEMVLIEPELVFNDLMEDFPQLANARSIRDLADRTSSQSK
ncbi:3D domain-containing protein [Desulfonatronovibrio magnus]|uniref:3D domain-containing protein n=1 Tax=Desulfonatronovibrio magnus TaxID=698827 RepID=UPI000697FAC1|nr:3D domain-containing protein [Desulfonatronovibrio magnus]